jgi:hypothetical protein
MSGEFSGGGGAGNPTAALVDAVREAITAELKRQADQPVFDTGIPEWNNPTDWDKLAEAAVAVMVERLGPPF